MSLNWDDIENAIFNAVVAASGYPPEMVTWAYQDKNEQANDHITLALGGEIPIGMDRLKTTYSAQRQQGQEIKVEAKGDREVVLSIDVFTGMTLGETAARRVAGKISAGLGLPGVRGRMTRYGITPFDPQPIQWVPDIPNANFRGRANLDVRCYVPLMGVFEYTTYIARVSGLVTVLGAAGTPVETVPFDSSLAPSTLVGIVVSPPAPTVVHGQVLAMTAQGIFSDGSQGDVTAAVAWTSSASSVATVDTGATAGHVHGVVAGAATITATLSGISAGAALTVT